MGVCLPAFAQTNVDAMEYFFDIDPGLGNGVSIPITPGPVQNVNISISTAGLTVGFHTLMIRAKHQSGNWGVQDERVVYVASGSVATTATLNAMEYYIDTDPGPGNGVVINIPGVPTSVDLFPAIPTSSLMPGFHILHIRARDDGGNWGIPDIRPFYIVPGSVDTQAEITQLEFFFDSEPGFGAGTPLIITSGIQIDIPALISSAALSTGFHSISIRAKDEDGQWGFAETRTFYVDGFSQVTAMEYYIDTDPGEGSATTVAVTPGGLVDIDFIIPTTSLAGGSHTVGIRAAGTGGTWGSVSTLSFSVQEGQTITFGALAAATYGDAPFNLAGSSSSGLALSYNSSDPLVATISGSTVTITGAGSTTITASQAGDGAFEAAVDIPQTLIVNKASQTITFGALAPKTVGDPAFTLGGTSTSTLGIVYSSSNTSVATISGNTVTIVSAGTTNITASQSGNGNYNAATDVVQPLVVQPATNPPGLTIPPNTAFYVNAPVAVSSMITVTDTDGSLTSATISITSGFQSAEDQLLFDLQGGITGSYNATTGMLAFSGAAPVADYQAVLRSVRYNNTASSPNTGDRTISFQVNDGTSASNAAVATIIINKPPAIEAAPKETQAGGNVVFLAANIFSDPDDNLDLTSLTVTSAQGAVVTISSGIITINYNSIPDFEGTDQLTITICDLGGKCQVEVVAVDVGADVEVFNGISANGDTMNAYLRIRFLPTGSSVSVINRWGDIVFESTDYDSSDPSKRFEGNSTDGNELMTGTYFYKIVLPDKQERTGYLHLKR
jgi:hypothetical protein